MKRRRAHLKGGLNLKVAVFDKKEEKNKEGEEQMTEVDVPPTNKDHVLMIFFTFLPSSMRDSRKASQISTGNIRTELVSNLFFYDWFSVI